MCGICGLTSRDPLAIPRRSSTSKVALSGQGADELLGRYRKHQVGYASDFAQRACRPRCAALLG